MAGFLGPTNNKKSYAYLTRTGSYSTVGSRKGFVDDNSSIPQDQMNTLLDERKILGQKINALSKIVKEVRKDLGLKQGKQLKHFINIANRGMLNNSKKDSQLLLETMPIVEELVSVKKRITEANVKIAELRPKRFSDRILDILKEEYSALFEEIKQRVSDEDVKLFEDQNNAQETQWPYQQKHK